MYTGGRNEPAAEPDTDVGRIDSKYVIRTSIRQRTSIALIGIDLRSMLDRDLYDTHTTLYNT